MRSDFKSFSHGNTDLDRIYVSVQLTAEFCICSSSRTYRIIIETNCLEIQGYFVDAVIQTAHWAVGQLSE
jgi:hypothetical protein